MDTVAVESLSRRISAIVASRLAARPSAGRDGPQRVARLHDHDAAPAPAGRPPAPAPRRAVTARPATASRTKNEHDDAAPPGQPQRRVVAASVVTMSTLDSVQPFDRTDVRWSIRTRRTEVERLAERHAARTSYRCLKMSHLADTVIHTRSRRSAGTPDHSRQPAPSHPASSDAPRADEGTGRQGGRTCRPTTGRAGNDRSDEPAEVTAIGSGSTRRASTRRRGGDAPQLRAVTAVVSAFPDLVTADLTARQRRILEFIRDWVERYGYPPSVREIGEAVGLVSPSSVAYQLKELERKGFLRRDPNRPRAVDVRPPSELGRRRGGRARRPPHPGLRAGARPDRRRWPDPRRAGRRGRLPAAARAGRRGRRLHARRSRATR